MHTIKAFGFRGIVLINIIARGVFALIWLRLVAKTFIISKIH